MSAPPLVARYAQLLLAVILLKPFSNLVLALGMRRMPLSLSVYPALFVIPVSVVLAGALMQGLWLLLRMRLLSIADLSFVLPVTAVGYVITTLLGWVFLHEHVSASRWLGTALISLGTALVVGGRHAMSPPPPDAE